MSLRTPSVNEIVKETTSSGISEQLIDIYSLYIILSTCKHILYLGFESGFIRWDDEDNENVNSFDGTLPSGVYDADTVIYYCCR